jgi:sensor histidine kinase YesM
MTAKLQQIIHKSQNYKTLRILFHSIFWIIVGSFYLIVFNRNSEIKAVSYILSIGLLPVAFLEAYFFNYILIPKYLGQRHYGKFFLFSFYTILTSTWLSFLIVMFALIFILNKDASLDPAVLHPELQVISLNFIVFLSISITQVKQMFYMQQERNELEKNALTTELKLKEAELKLLKAQIHPHFLFNTLNNLYGLTIEKSDEAPRLVLQLSEILDYILYRCNDKNVALSEELNNLKNYIEVEKIRYSEKLELKTEFPEKIENLKIAPLILLPFVENAFKHGVSNFPGTGFVNLKISTFEKNLIFNIKNSKNELVKKEENYSKGIGLINVRKRLDLIYPEKYILSINELAETFSVNLTLELDS